MTIEQFNILSSEEAFKEIFKCCGATNWAHAVVAKRPYSTVALLKESSDAIWNACGTEDFLEAFTHHPKIGDKKSLEKKFASTSSWASNEQSGVDSANDKVLDELAKGNTDYENKFGYIFIVCASGKSAEEMLQLLQERLPNSPEQEIVVAAGEQNKITHIRIDKLFS
jgi:2-oxo-4-hydroxy-4-carboxy-5-ureidoimidazoline decarboxylase